MCWKTIILIDDYSTNKFYIMTILKKKVEFVFFIISKLTSYRILIDCLVCLFLFTILN